MFDSARVIVHVIAVVIVKALSQDMGMVSMQMLMTMTDVDNSVHDDCDDYDASVMKLMTMSPASSPAHKIDVHPELYTCNY